MHGNYYENTVPGLHVFKKTVVVREWNTDYVGECELFQRMRVDFCNKKSVFSCK